MQPLKVYRRLALVTAGLVCGCWVMTPNQTVHAQYQNNQYQNSPLNQNSQSGVTRASYPSATSSSASNVAAVRISGNKRVPTDQIMSRLRTRTNRQYDPDLIQADVQEIMRMRFFRNVKTKKQQTPQGVVVTFDIIERPFIDEVKFVGNRHLTDRALLKEANLKAGQPLDVHRIKMARQRIEDFYDEKGLGRTEVEIVEGNDVNDQKVVFLIHEDDPQKIRSVKVIGNTITSSARLRSFVKSKPSVLRTFGGKHSEQKVETDKQILTSYYRSLGFFNAKVGCDVIQEETGRWVSLVFVVDEGPRFKVRNVSFVGTQKYSQEQLRTIVGLKSGEYFHSPRMQEDINTIRDLYGSQGHIGISVDAEHLFYEQPGVLDLVYKVTEGPQYRLGKINVHIEGDHGVTRKQVILNRIGLKPGDVIDMRKIRASERRLASSQLFTTGGAAGGGPPRLVVAPRETGTSFAERPNGNYRGQSADLDIVIR